MVSRRITCITSRGNEHHPHERISSVGGIGWSRTVAEVIHDIETGANSYYVQVGVRSVGVVVANNLGRKYLKTIDDGYVPSNLLRLPSCANPARAGG